MLELTWIFNVCLHSGIIIIIIILLYYIIIIGIIRHS